jgi:hypothetical protein
VSEQPTGAPREGSGQPGAKKPGKKILGMSRGQAAGLGVVAVGGLIFLIWRARKNAAAASSAASTTSSSCPDGSTPDANGNCPQDSSDFSGALETLHSEIAALQGAGAGGGGSDGSAGTVAGSTGTPTTTPPAATTTTTAPAASTATTTAAPKPAAAAGPIANLRATSTGTTSFTAAWNAAQGATGGYSYIVRDLATHTQVGGAHTTKGTSATVTGLKSGTDYNFGIQGLPGGAGNNIHVRTK